MSDGLKLFLLITASGVATYLLRVLPLVIFRKQISAPFFVAFIELLPFTILAPMVVPDIFYCIAPEEAHPACAYIGFFVALVFSILEKPLLTVATFAVIATMLAKYLF